MFGVPIHVWVGIPHLGQDKGPYLKQKYLITLEIKHVCTQDLAKSMKYTKRRKDFYFSQKKGRKDREAG